MRTILLITGLLAVGALLGRHAGVSRFTSAVHAQDKAPEKAKPPGNAVPVTADNFRRAESDRYFAATVKRAGIGQLSHLRELVAIDKQTVVRLNRDTLYSSGVFDLDAGPVTITLPDAGK